MKVRLADEAEVDLEAIGDEIAKDNPARAASFIHELRERCLGLARYPKRFPLVPRYERRGVRHCVHGNYLIFYRVDVEAVIVIHVLHGAMDYSRILFPSE
ncbi:MAG TPA: type II toxin-antitoxin system RelE/ParE family toxin [Allosphingosinicella sp.]